MLTQENIDQIFDEHGVWELDRAARAEHLNIAVYCIAQKRASVLYQSARITDGVFAAWAICLPFFPQPESYTQFMAQRRRQWFQGLDPKLLPVQASAYFSDSLLRLDLHQLAEIVTAEDAVTRIQEYLGTAIFRADRPRTGYTIQLKEIRGDTPFERRDDEEEGKLTH